MKALLLVGSPRGKRSTSYSLGTYLLSILQERGFEIKTLIVKLELASDKKVETMLKEVNASDVIILTAPLYDDSQPYIVVKLMELIAAKEMKLDTKRFIPIINCGFFESVHITAVAISIYHQFAKTMNLRWVGSLAIGGGEMFGGARGKLLDDLGKIADKMKMVLFDVAEKLSSDVNIGDLVPMVFPKLFDVKLLKKGFIKMNNRSWKKQAEINGGKVDAKPYLE